MPTPKLPSTNFVPQIGDLLPAVSTPIPGIADVTGPMFLGHVFNWALLGALTMQVYRYHVAFAKNDRVVMKVMVYGVYILDLFQTACATHYGWYVLASGWGNPWTLRYTAWTLGMVPVLTGLIAMIVQFFFAWRIHILGGIKWILWPVNAFIIATALGQCVAAMYSGIKSSINLDVDTWQSLEPPVTVWLGFCAACDIAITMVLVIQLRRRIGLGFGTYNPRIQRAIRLLFETNLITTLVVIVELVTFLQRATASWYFFFGMLIGKLYSNTLLATLNSRESIASTPNTAFNNSTTGQSSGAQVWKDASRIEPQAKHDEEAGKDIVQEPSVDRDPKYSSEERLVGEDRVKERNALEERSRDSSDKEVTSKLEI